MSVNTILIVTAISLVFGIFALTIAWAQIQASERPPMSETDVGEDGENDLRNAA